MEPKIVCGVCLYGDGNWKDETRRGGAKKPENLPICEKCKADCWITASSPEGIKAIAEDPLLGDKIGFQSPF